ncbi:SKP1-like protein 1 [Triticum dicoccoides]|uniref:SKP1-like protein 1 n=1 Tax=Triticum dicoccoides TaxID=85692 RepID=UPI00188F09CE|nr:SKP1-like protein 1 [Triticum dicoccoides]
MAAMGDTSKIKMIMLKTSDGDEFEVEEAVAMESLTIRHMIENECTDNETTIPNVDSKILSKVIEYCYKHVHAKPCATVGGATCAVASDTTAHATLPEDLKNWDAEFLKVNPTVLYDIILAACHLNLEGLVDLISQTMTDMIKGKTTEEIRKMFNLKNDFMLEE